MVNCEIVTVHIWTPIISAHLPSLMLEHLSDFKETLQQFRCLYPIVLGDLNVDLDDARR